MTDEQKLRFMRLTHQSPDHPHINVSAAVEMERRERLDHAGEASLPEVHPVEVEEFSDEVILDFVRALNRWLDKHGEERA